MGVRRILTLSVRPGARVLHHRRGRRKRSIRLDRQQRDTSTGVVGDEHHPAASVYAHEAGRCTFRRLLVSSSERPGVARDREGAHRTARLPIVLLNFVHRVENAAVRVDGEKRRLLAGVHRAHSAQLARLPVHANEVDAITPVGCSVRPDVEELIVGLRLTLKCDETGG